MGQDTTTKALLVILIIVALVALGVLITGGTSGDAPQMGETTPTPTPAPAGDTPDAVANSELAAISMYQELRDDGYDARIFITQRGTIGVSYNTSVQSGAELKSEMQDVALVYAGVISDHPDAGGLTVTANGVQMLVSSDTALAHAEERIDEEAYFETLVFKSANAEE